MLKLQPNDGIVEWNNFVAIHTMPLGLHVMCTVDGGNYAKIIESIISVNIYDK